MPESKAHQLLQSLDLTVVRGGPNGRYPCGEPGPAPGFCYWVTEVGGRLKFGLQQSPKQEMSRDLQDRLKSHGFLLTPKMTEGFVWLEPGVDASIDPARAAMARLRSLL